MITLSRRLFGHIKSLLHFDFPHYGGWNKSLMENNGLHDEASNEFWSFNGNATLDGNRYKVYSVPSGSAKFGWRSLQTKSASDYISCANAFNTFTLKSQGSCEIECFIQSADSNAGNIISFLNGNSHVFTISREASGKIKLYCPQWNLNATSTAEWGSGSWHHIRVRISDNTAMLFADGVLSLSVALTPNITLPISECRIGGFYGYIDEFVFRDAADSTNSVPSSAYQGKLDISAMGGFGTGKHGALLVPAGQRKEINAYCSNIIKGSDGSSAITLNAAGWVRTSLGNPAEGDEIMLIVYPKVALVSEQIIGRYAFRYITAADGNNLTLDKSLDEDFSMSEALKNYRVYAFHIPHFTSVTVENNAMLVGTLFGFCAFRCSGNVNISGYVAPSTTSAGHLKTDNILITHSQLPDRFIMSKGGGVMIFCGGTLNVAQSGYIGHNKNEVERANSCGLGGNGGGTNGEAGGIMKGGASVNGTQPNWKNHGPLILIAAKYIHAEKSSISAGGLHGSSSTDPGQYSGLCYMAGNFLSD